MWFIAVEVEQETSAPPPKKNPGCAPGDVTRDDSQRRFLAQNSVATFLRH